MNILSGIQKGFQISNRLWIKWKRINYSSKKDDWKMFDKIHLTIALNILYIKEKEIKKYVQLIFQKLIQIVKNK